jgi:hypothetical protein
VNLHCSDTILLTEFVEVVYDGGGFCDCFSCIVELQAVEKKAESDRFYSCIN